jgi:hypothetical protein
MRLIDFAMEYADAAEQLTQEQNERKRNMAAQMARGRNRRRR